MKMDEDYAVEAAMGMRFRLQMRQDNMATGKAEQRMPFTSPEISFFFSFTVRFLLFQPWSSFPSQHPFIDPSQLLQAPLASLSPLSS